MGRKSALANKRKRIVEHVSGIVEHVSGIALFKSGRTLSCLEDRISNLPDEILVSILSRLKIEQAARTSVLACRWRYLWRLTRGLKFEIRNWSMLHYDDDLFDVRCREFVDCVNHVLKLHHGTTIDEFSIGFCFNDENYKPDIDNWISFAFQKRVKRLQLNFHCGWTNGPLNFPLSDEILHSYRLDSLTSLHMCHVSVTGEGLEYILSVCPILEELAVLDSKTLVKFTVSGPSLKLKHLEIGSRCLESLNIYDVNLVSLKYSGAMPKTSISFKDTPYLVKACFAGPYARYIIKKSILESSYLPRLEILVLDLTWSLELRRFPKFPKLRNLRQLELKLNPGVSGHLLCAYLLKASPLLRKLRIEFNDFNYSMNEVEMKVRRRPIRRHKCLEVVELIGFIGCGVDLDIALYIMGSAFSLRKIIIDPRQPNKWECQQDPDKQGVARTRVKQHLETRFTIRYRISVALKFY